MVERYADAAPLLRGDRMNARTYRGCIMSRITSHNMAGMRWETYCNGRFLKSETLAGLRHMIRAELSP